MDVINRQGPDEIVISLSGRFDEAAVAERRLWFEALAGDATKNVCLDLAEVTIIDSAAIGTIAFLFKRLAARQKRLCLAGPNGQPLELLKVLRLDRVIAIRPLAPAAKDPKASAREPKVPGEDPYALGGSSPGYTP